MKIQKAICWLIILFNIPFFIQASSTTDSLKTTYNSTVDVIEKANILYSLSEQYGFSQPDSSFLYAQKLVQFIQENEKNLKGEELIKLIKIKAKGKNNLGVLFYVMGNLNKGIEYLNKSITDLEQIKDTLGLIDSYNNLIQLYEAAYDHKNTINAISKMTSLAEAINDKETIAKAYFTYGSLYIQLEDYENAIKKYNKVLDISNQTNDSTLKCRVYSQLGIINRNLGYDSIALNYFLMSYELAKNSDNPILKSTLLNNIGSVYNDNKDYEKALFYARQSLLLRTKSGLVNEIYKSYNNIARLFFRTNKKDSALYYSNLAYELSKKMKSDYGLRESTQLLYLYYLDKKDFKKALQYHEEYTKYSLAINDIETKKSLDKLLLKEEYFQTLKTDSINAANELKLNKAILEAKISNQKKVIYFVVGIVVVLILLSFFIYKNYRQKVKYSEKIELQSMLLETKNQEITDSIQYAKRLQDAILPSLSLFENSFADSFVVYIPKDIVAGDFYFLEKVGDSIIFAAADCTGHGVPGAMVSVVCSNALNRAVNEYQLTKPSEILEKVRQLVTKTFQKSESEVRDGMDISICNLNINTNELLWAGANNPLWIVRTEANEIEELKADKQAIGYTENPNPFTTHKIQLQAGDLIYIFSDGFADQFGGEKGKKFKSASMKKLLISLKNKNLNEQKSTITKTFNNWKGDLEQVDDICLIGVRI